MSPQALITPDEYRGLIGQEDADSGRPETLIQAHIDVASSVISDYCGRVLIAPASAEEFLFDGTGDRKFYLKNWPIADSPVPTLKWYDGVNWQAVEGWYTIKDAGIIYFPVSRFFIPGFRNYKFTGILGYTITTLPGSLKYACAQLIFRQLRKMVDKQEGISSESFDSHNVSYDLNKFPPDLRAILDKHRRIVVG